MQITAHLHVTAAPTSPAGDAVPGALVTSVTIPAFARPPDILLWGDRVFAFNDLSLEGEPIYVEAFAYVVPTA